MLKMDTQVTFAWKAVFFTLLLILVGFFLTALNFFDERILAFLPFLPPWSLAAFSGGIVVILSVYVWVRERRFEVLKYEFVNIVTHKFRTPLTYVNWSIENLKKNQTGDERAESVRQIENASNRLIELTDILVGMAKIDEGYAYVFKATSFREIIENTLKLYIDHIKEKNIKFNIEMSYDLPLIAVDVKRIEFVVKVLLENAFKYTPQGGLIDMKVALENNKAIRFSITDTGIGIKSEDLPHIFSKFFRSHEATGADTEGMGLGLYISRNIIKRHGGKIWAESGGNNTGATFTFEIPLRHGQ
ncbi:MAG: HAMP domain-containing sensor histidine kinase [bacterium]|nr:HAMP domain-containing sensor histidine kinase [bacterium]